MYNIILTIHILLTVSLIGIILMQRSASDGMGLSNSSSNSFLSGRAAASVITRATALLATLFILTSLALGVIAARGHTGESSIMDRLDNGKSSASKLLSPRGSSSDSTPRPTSSTANGPIVPVSPEGVPVKPALIAPVAPQTPAQPSVPRPE